MRWEWARCPILFCSRRTNNFLSFADMQKRTTRPKRPSVAEISYTNQKKVCVWQKQDIFFVKSDEIKCGLLILKGNCNIYWFYMSRLLILCWRFCMEIMENLKVGLWKRACLGLRGTNIFHKQGAGGGDKHSLLSYTKTNKF